MLASLDDLKTFLPPDKFDVRDGNTELNLCNTDAERVVKGYLSSVFTAATIAAWDEPSATPDYIRAIAARLTAAFYYAKKVSEDIPDWDGTYPQRLYDQAVAMLADLRSGLVDLPEIPEDPGTQFDSSFFSPANGEPKFTMDMRW